MNNIDDILMDNPVSDIDKDDLEDVYEIDMESIGHDANIMAAGSIDNLMRLYKNKDFVEGHPEFKKRVDAEIETLRKLYKMSNTNEQIHDHLAEAIAKQSGNASLYMAMSRLQATIMDIDDRIRKTLNSFNTLCTAYQTEMNFDYGDDAKVTGQPREDSNGDVTSRGNKAFIEHMADLDDDEEE